MTLVRGSDITVQADLGTIPFVLDLDNLDGTPGPPGAELVVDGSFENSTLPNWNESAQATSFADTGGGAGARVLRIVGNGSANWPQAWQDVAATAGTSYTVSANMNRVSGTSPCRLRVEAVGASGTPVVATLERSAAGWAVQSTSFVAPTGTTALRITCLLDAAPAGSGHEGRYDSVSVKAAGPATGAELTPLEDAWTDVTCDISSASWSWGATEPLGPLTECEGGRLRLSIYDPDRAFDPSNDASPYLGAVRVGMPLRVLADGVPAWTGRLESWQHDLGAATSDLTGTDALGTLAQLILQAGTTIPAGYSAAQAAAVLNAAGWPATARDFSGGSAAYRTSRTVDGSALEALASVRFAEHAALWAKRDGSVGWRGRDEPYEPAPSVVVNCGGAALGSLVSTLARGRVRNVVLIDGGTPDEYSAATQVSHGPRTVRTSMTDLALATPVLLGGLGPANGHVTPAAAPTNQTLSSTKSSLLARSGSTELGGGADQHIPIGYSGGYNLRGCVAFESPDWSGVSSVVSATLHIKTTGQVHLAFGSDSRVLIKRITSSWTPNSASSGIDGGGGWSTSGLVYPGPSSTTSGQVEEALPETENDWTEVDCTAILRACAPVAAGGSGASWYGLMVLPSDESSATRNNEFYSHKASSGNRPYITLVVATNKRPNAPTPVGPIGANALATNFVFRVTDPEGDTITNWQVLLKDAAGATVWNPTGGGTLSSGQVTLPYAGPALTAQQYTWQARATDAGGYGSWSTLVAFTPGSLPATPEASWATAILTALANPAVLTVLGTILPEASEVVPIVCGEFGERWQVVDDETVPPINRVVRLVGASVSIGPDRIEVDAVTEDV